MKNILLSLGTALLLLASGRAADTPALRQTIALPAAVAVEFTAVSPNGKLIAGACHDGKVRVWNGTSGALVYTVDLGPGHIHEMRFSQDGTVLAGSVGESVRLWESGSGSLNQEFMVPAAVSAMALSPDKTLLAIAPAGSPVEVWDVRARKSVAKMAARFGGSTALAFSADGRWLASADTDTDVRIFDVHDWTLHATATDMLLETFALSFSVDGKYIVAGGADQTITLIDPGTGKLVRSLNKQANAILELRVSRDSRFVAALYLFDPDGHQRSVPPVIWDMETGSIQSRIVPKDDAFNGGELLSDGTLVFTSGSEKELKVWFVR